MNGANKVISIENYQRLRTLVDEVQLRAEAPQNRSEEAAGVISLIDYRKKNEAMEAEIQQAEVRAREMLRAIIGLARDYETQMVAVANQQNREEWQDAYEQDPYAQIQYDIYRLQRLCGALEYALDAEGIHTLSQAAAWIEQHAEEEIQYTLQYVQQSEYLGFQAISGLIQCGSLQEEGYLENSPWICEAYQAVVDEGFIYAVEPLGALCFADAVEA